MNINCGLQQDTFQLECNTVKSNTTASFIVQPSTRTNAQDSWSGANGIEMFPSSDRKVILQVLLSGINI